MTPDELTKKVTRAMEDAWEEAPSGTIVREVIVRAALRVALEEAAKVAESFGPIEVVSKSGLRITIDGQSKNIATAIRALIVSDV